ncbi:SAV_2336 N-terminal domain-related protein [Nonomuraea lactucae]|uniref:SAV_2336 N-terminal domain-related protein n=1 Tax=Nonomuraea lactucae TaxID=2249762 RepID=UPI001F0584E9|nr:SAV_2336 N-terminal domain-related protein [Nonomuraea lactucae]
MTASIDGLRRVLSAVGQPPTAVELAERLWLAMMVRERGPAAERGSPVTREPVEKPEPPARLPLPESPPAPADARREIYSHATPESAGGSATAVQLSSAPMLSGGMKLNRALRPLRRRALTRHQRTLDERATVDRIARQYPQRRSPWVPVLVPTLERRLNLTLVIDFGPSMDLWRPMGEELRELCTNLGAFRNVRLTRLEDGPHGITAGSAGPPGALTDPSGRQLVLLLSDCSGSHWWAGRMARTVRRWASSSPTAILQPLPERLWHRTAITVTAHRAVMARPFTANPSLRLHPERPDQDRSNPGVAIPVVGLSAPWFANWAQMMAGNMTPVAVTHLDDQPAALGAWVHEERAQPVEEQILRLRAVASPQAYSLAGYLATASFPSLPLIRLMQQALLPGSAPEHLAEVMLSGLLHPSEQHPGFYTFVPGARRLLLRSMSRTGRRSAIHVLQAVSRELAARAGTGTATFLGYLPGAPPSGDRVVRTAGDPFGLISSEADGVSDPVLAAGADRRGESAAERLYERMAGLARAQSPILWITSPTGAVLEDAPQWRAITGQALEEYLADGWLGAVHPGDLPATEEAWRGALRGQSTFEWGYRVRTRAGGYRHFQVRAVPITRQGRVTEWVGANEDVTSQRESEEARELLTDQLGQAAIRTARLQGATARLAEALTVEEVGSIIMEVGRTALAADRSAVALLDPERGSLKLVSGEGLHELPGGHASETSLAAISVMTLAARKRVPFVAESPEALEAQFLEAGSDEHTLSGFLAHTDERAWVGLPLLVAGRSLGALRFSFTQPQKISPEDRVFLEALAAQCALAVERGTLFERENRTAETLQRSLLPDRLPVVRGLELAHRFRSGTHHVMVGGDFFDAFELGDGRVAAVVGDAMGKGIAAAIVMGRTRTAIRTLALVDPPPASVLTGLDRVFTETEDPEQLATLAYLVIEPGTGRGSLALAGHPPPVLISPDGRAKLTEVRPGTPLGWPSVRRQSALAVPPGHTAVLYSDGLVWNRERGLDKGLAELRLAVEEAPAEVVGSPHMLLDYLVDRMLSGYEQEDDVTVLAIRVPPVASDRRSGPTASVKG